ncbi:MAG TPA: hypothetical protein VGR35_07930 [Tepidisphaeraceae bacterium]|nr:hypothetical protein [Tepidisphaeraceae bacterium]
MPLVRIQSDPRARLKPCLRCGYSLRNNPDARVCPECGLSVWLTLGGNDDLEMSNPQWLRRLALAAGLLAGANVALFGGVGMIHFGKYLWNGNPRFTTFLSWPYDVVLPWFLVAYLGLSALGLFLLGGHEGRYPERARSRRTMALAGAGVAAVFVLWLIVWQLTRNTRPPMFLVVVALCGQAAAGWMYLAEVARRVPSQRARRLCRGLAIALGIAVLALIFSGSFRLFLALVNPWSRFALGWTLFLLIYPPLAVGLLAYFARTFHKASQAARRNWEPEPGAT